MKALQDIAAGIVMVCLDIMRVIGVADDWFTRVMQACGILSPSGQWAILLTLLVLYLVLALRAIGGMVGWTMVFLAVLLLLHRTLPGMTAPNAPVAPQLENALS